MPWVNPNEDLTDAEFDAFVQKCEDENDTYTLRSDLVPLSSYDLFDHTAGEIEELNQRDREAGRIVWGD